METNGGVDVSAKRFGNLVETNKESHECRVVS